jgi:hypothetical protein
MRTAAAAALVLLATGAAPADPGVYRKALRSTGWVVIPRTEDVMSGTCWLADLDRRLVVTCRHVVGDSREVLVYFPSYEKDRPVVEATRYLRKSPAVVGRVVAADAARDLALIRLASVPEGVQEMPLAGRSSSPGDDVHSIGNSGLRGDLDEGTLRWYTRGSARQVHRRKVQMPEGARLVWFVETQSPVNEGDSGGPVVNADGELVGVTDSYTKGERLVSQNVDVREVKAFLKESADAGAEGLVPGGPTPVGGWTFKAAAGGKTTEGDGEFRADGTFVLNRTGSALEGRYAFINGVLWLIAGDGFARGSLVWEGDDAFSLKVGKVEMTFARKPAEKAAEEVGEKP